MTDNSKRPVIIRRVKKVSGGHHGGAWKVAYADFMTAMMAFFLLLWLLNVSQEDKLTGIADYFAEDRVPLTNIGGNGVAKGSSLSEEDLIGDAVPKPTISAEDTEEEAAKEKAAEKVDEQTLKAGAGVENPWAKLARSQSEQAQGTLEEHISEIRDRLDAYADSVVIHERNGNIVIDILDLSARPMFQSASADLTADNLVIAREVASVLGGITGPVEITGHTDGVPYGADEFYGNWELSADRANSMRRALIGQGLPETRIDLVAGAADTMPLDRLDPDAPENRRVSIEITLGL